MNISEIIQDYFASVTNEPSSFEAQNPQQPATIFDNIQSETVSKANNEIEQTPYTELLNVLKENTIEKFHLGKSTLPEVVALEQKMQSLGVKVTFEDNLETAKVITSAFEKMKAKGFKLPERVILMTPKEQYSQMKGWITTGYENAPSLVLFNKDLSINNKEQLPSFMEEQGIKYNATDTKEGVVFHEMGHFLHQRNPNAGKIWKDMANEGYDLALAKEVGYYAMTGDKFNRGNEFVAEVFAGLMSGKQYSPRVIAIYEALGGAKISNR